jgi:hypothetical protein
MRATVLLQWSLESFPRWSAGYFLWRKESNHCAACGGANGEAGPKGEHRRCE